MENYTRNAHSTFGDTDQQNAPNDQVKFLNIIQNQSTFDRIKIGRLYLRIHNGRTKEPN